MACPSAFLGPNGQIAPEFLHFGLLSKKPTVREENLRKEWLHRRVIANRAHQCEPSPRLSQRCGIYSLVPCEAPGDSANLCGWLQSNGSFVHIQQEKRTRAARLCMNVVAPSPKSFRLPTVGSKNGPFWEVMKLTLY